MSKKITGKQIWQTIHKDLIGKDSHRGITLTYGWFANQLGHLSLGFIPTAILHIVGFTAEKSFLYVALFWLLFEIYNVLSPLYKSEYKGNGTFKIHWANLTFDTFTDLCFFWLGSGFYFVLVVPNSLFLWFFFGFIVFIFFPSRFWFLTKLYQQNAFFPYQYRLSQWNGFIHSEDAEIISELVSNKKIGVHLVILGEKRTGKTTISVGVGNELSIRHKRTTYTTLAKWVSTLDESDELLRKSGRSLWAWIDADFLIIDDINPGVPEEANLYEASNIYGFIQNSKFLERNKATLSTKSVAWVVGSCSCNDDQKNWIQMLENIGIERDKIIVVNLNKDS